MRITEMQAVYLTVNDYMGTRIDDIILQKAGVPCYIRLGYLDQLVFRVGKTKPITINRVLHDKIKDWVYP